jgi:hypothetical protein
MTTISLLALILGTSIVFTAAVDSWLRRLEADDE